MCMGKLRIELQISLPHIYRISLQCNKQLSCGSKAWKTYILAEQHISQEDEDAVETREDGEQVVKCQDVVIDRKYTKYPRHAQ